MLVMALLVSLLAFLTLSSTTEAIAAPQKAGWDISKTKAKAKVKAKAKAVAKAKAKAKAKARAKARAKAIARAKAKAKTAAQVKTKVQAKAKTNTPAPNHPTNPDRKNQSENAENAPVRDAVNDKAMWLWNWDSNAQVIEFAKTHRVTDVFTYAHPGFSTDSNLRNKLLEFTQAAKSQGIRPWAMGGDPSWVTNHQDALAWVNEATTSGLFNGVHLEIEPHSQEGYWENQTSRNEQYLELLSKVKEAVGDQVLELSLPWWFHTISHQGTTLDRLAIEKVDQIAIATFNNSVSGVQDNAAHAVQIAKSLSKPYRLASETNAVEADWITFVGATNSTMLAVQAEVSEKLKADPNYLGFAVHEFQGWFALRD